MSQFLTLGHSKHDLEGWLAILRQHAVEIVADLRSAPYSKHAPQFDRESLQRSLEQAGIRYLFLGAELGGRPANPDCYDAHGHVLYSHLCDEPSFQAALAQLEADIERYCVALLCGEENPAHCHRRLLVGRVLTERGHTMLHIRGDGRLDSDEAVATEGRKPLVGAQPALFAELTKDQWKSTASVLHRKT